MILERLNGVGAFYLFDMNTQWFSDVHHSCTYVGIHDMCISLSFAHNRCLGGHLGAAKQGPMA